MLMKFWFQEKEQEQQLLHKGLTINFLGISLHFFIFSFNKHALNFISVPDPIPDTNREINEELGMWKEALGIFSGSYL